MGFPQVAEERQGSPRRLVACIGELRCGDDSVDCEILNISETGAQLCIERQLTETSSLVLASDIGEFACELIWQNADYAGVRFQVEAGRVAECIEAYLDQPTNDDDRRHVYRKAVLWGGRLSCGGESTNCLVMNVSVGGAKLRAERFWNFVSPVTLEIDRFGSFKSDVAWQDGDLIGVKFQDSPEEIQERLGPALPNTG